ncbi:hypothetical protein PoB_002003500, partial [Plakobranchus ocellatus]
CQCAVSETKKNDKENQVQNSLECLPGIVSDLAKHLKPSVSTDGEQDTAESAKAPGRRLGVYSQMKNLKNLAFKKLKVKGGKKKAGKSTKTDTLSDSEEIVVHSDGEGGWQHRGGNAESDDSGDSSGTEYEDIEPDRADFDGEDVPEDGDECPYEDLESLGLGTSDSGSTRASAGRGGGAASSKNKTLTHKLKNIFYNKKAKAAKKNKPVVDSGVSADTDSEGDQVDGGSEGPPGPVGDASELPALDAISRSSSERSSGRFAREDFSESTKTVSTSTTAAEAISSAGSSGGTTTSSGLSSLSSDGNTKSTTSLSSTSSLPPTTTFAAASFSTAPSTTSLSSTTSVASSSSLTHHSTTPMSSSNMPPPPLPPRTSKNLSQPAENSPPLPPRNPSLSIKSTTLGIPLDTVVPISPPGNRSSVAGRPEKNSDRFSFGSDNSSTTAKLDYIDYDPASAQTLERIEKSERRSNASSRPLSSSSNTSSSGGGSSSNYMYPDLSAFPQLKGDSNDDNLYVDLLSLTERDEDEHIYGKASDIYQSRFESEPLYQWYSKDKMIQNTRSDKSTSDDLSDEEYLELEDQSHPESVYEDVERLLEKTSTQAVIKDKPPVKSNSSGSADSLTTSVSARDKPQRRSVIEDVFKKGGNLHRALWCQMPEVIASGLLEKLTDQQKKIQE